MDLADHLPWVRRLARRFHPNDRDDCVQAGLLVVAQKLAEFDASRGIKFETFAKARVLGAMVDSIRDRSEKRIPASAIVSINSVPHLRARDDVLSEVDLADMREQMHAIIESLRPVAARVLRGFVAGEQQKSIARRERLSRRAVSSIWTRGLRQLAGARSA